MDFKYTTILNELKNDNVNISKLYLAYELKNRNDGYNFNDEFIEVIYSGYLDNNNYFDIITYINELIEVISYDDKNIINLSLNELDFYIDKIF